MRKIFNVAWREFTATVGTKAFILGVFLPPVLMVGVFTIMPRLMNAASPKVTGHIALIDPTGVVAPRVTEAFSPGSYAERTAKRIEKDLEEIPAPAVAKDMAKKNAGVAAMSAAQKAPTLSVKTLAPDSDVEAAKLEIRKAGDKARESADSDTRLALAVIQPDAVKPGQDGKYGQYDFFVAPKLDFEVQRDIQQQIGAAIVDARIQASGLDSKAIRAITDVPRVEAKSVTAEGEKSINEAAKLLVPGAFMFLLWMSTFSCGQYLLTSTIEEKSSRVMEVLLSAVSPMQLLTGKIIGQMCVGILILTVYCGLGVSGLVLASMLDILPFINLVYLFVYFVIAFFLIASLMAAVGSAVSDVREAQSLLGPIMIVLVIPMMLWFPILRNPNSTFAQVCSFIPPLSPFVMILRLSGSEPVAAWQIPASIVLGIVSIIIALWAAGKIFRIGVLMYGKPPNFRTLLRWVRMA